MTRAMTWSSLLSCAVVGLLTLPAAAQEQRENPRTDAVDMVSSLLQNHPYLLTQEEKSTVDEINRRIREAQRRLREARGDADARKQADKAVAKAGEQFVAVLEKSEKFMRISFEGGLVKPSIYGPHEMVGDTGALLLRIENGSGGNFFSTYEIDQSLPESRKVVWIDYAPAGVTWVLLGMHTLPARTITLPIEFRRPDAEPIRTVAKVNMPETGRLKLTVQSDDSGKPCPAMVRITSKATGRDRKPSNAVDLTGQFDGNGNNSGHRPANIPGRQGGQWWCVPGPLDMTLPPGEYDIAIRRGVEHTPVFESFTVQSRQVTEKTYRPKRWIDMRTLGWYSGDDHVHGQILSDSDAARLMAWLQAEDIHLGNIVKMGDITRTYFEQRGFGKDYRVIDGDYVLSPGQECPRTHEYIGHTISMNTTSMVRDTDQYYLYDYVADTVHGQGGLWGYAHVNSGMFHVHRDMSVNIPKGKCDFVEVLQFGSLGTGLWYEFLDLGFKVTASSGSDVPWGGTIGEVRLYGYTGKKASFSADDWFEAVRKGRTFVTNGPMLEFTVNDALPGDEIVVKDNAKLHVRVKAMGQPEFSQLESVKVVKFGQDLKAAKPAKEGDNEITLEFDIEAENGFWLAAVAKATNGCHAHTTPIYVRREGLRWWKFDEVDQLIDKRLKSLQQIERLVAEANSKDEATKQGIQEVRQLVLQGPELLKRVEAARKIYEELKQTAEKEKGLRASSK